MENNLSLFEKSRIWLKLIIVIAKCLQIWILWISHGSAVEGKQKVLAGKSYYRYWYVFCNIRNMRRRMIYVFVAFCPCWNKKARLQENESRSKNKLSATALIKTDFWFACPFRAARQIVFELCCLIATVMKEMLSVLLIKSKVLLMEN